MSKLALLGGEKTRAKPWPSWPQVIDADVEAVSQVLREGPLCRVSGGKAQEFEKLFAEYQDAKYCVAMTSGTTALVVAVSALGIGPGDEVIVPAYTYIASATSVLLSNAVPIFADIDPETLNLSPASVKERLTERTKAIMPVHFGGLPADLDELRRLADKHKLRIIEDACHTHGGIWKGRKLGAVGDCGAFSFQESKNLTAGEGGAFVTDDEELFLRAGSMHNFGRMPGRPLYEHHALGSNYRISNMQAAFLVSQFQRLEEQTQRRYENGSLLTELLSKSGILRPIDPEQPPKSRRAYHLYITRYNGESLSGLSRDKFTEALQAEGIPCSNGYPVPLYENPTFKKRLFGPKGNPVDPPWHPVEVDYMKMECPETLRICSESVWFAQRLLLDDEEGMKQIAQAVEKIAEGHKELLGS